MATSSYAILILIVLWGVTAGVLGIWIYARGRRIQELDAELCRAKNDLRGRDRYINNAEHELGLRELSNDDLANEANRDLGSPALSLDRPGQGRS